MKLYLTVFSLIYGSIVGGIPDLRNDHGAVLFVGGGKGPGNPETDIEVLSLSHPDLTCTKPANANRQLINAVGTAFPEQYLMCGGVDLVGDCVEYHPGSDTWTQTLSLNATGRAHAAAVKINDNQWWILGGLEVPGATFTKLATTELYTEGQGFSPYIDMPEARFTHCLTQLNRTHFFLVGQVAQVHIFDMTTEQWLELEPLPGLPTEGPACGTVRLEDGNVEVVVTGGDLERIAIMDTHIFSLETLTWRSGPNYPVRVEDAAYVNWDDTLLVVGGRNARTNGQAHDMVYKYVSRVGDHVGAWEQLATLDIGRHHPTVFIPYSHPFKCA